MKDRKQKGKVAKDDSNRSSPLLSRRNIIRLVIYISLQLIATFLELGLVFFVCALFYLVFINTASESDTSKNPGDKVSAYSVFNKDMRRIDGTLTAEQFEKDILRKW
ncbi:hypothetical protein BJ742DRAFT_828898 [Cladochytrium replicatum]|nr:hypothetical protein BJ742DRAFT_828898 [Cladochytrium replicatum]